jgi:hypothetical protein
MSYTVILTGSNTNVDTGKILINDSFVSQEHTDLSHKERSRKSLVSHQIHNIILSFQDSATLPGNFERLNTRHVRGPFLS